jgi:hypothetical protein
MYKVRKVKMCAGLFTVMNNRTGTVILQVIYGVLVLQYRIMCIVGFVCVEEGSGQLTNTHLCLDYSSRELWCSC